ncbi:MAG TPA: decaprenyl-phosphate phosphoribosyltransferase [Marmoricola sp.]|nr:decaprenyl-phosphate phosphoribosyltransferase [Marmoricola sp.]
MATVPDTRPLARAAATPAASRYGDRGPVTLARALLALGRPRQWLKNALVLAAPAAGGVLLRPDALERSLVATVAFVAASAAVYALNDTMDVESDRRHPTKCRRPVAAGAISPRLALIAAAAAAVSAVALASALGWLSPLIVGCYLAVSVAYTLWLKHLPVVDVVIVAAGFVLRALGGASAVNLRVSSWFLLVSLFGALFIVSAKRRAEVRSLGPDARTRASLDAYTGDWLSQVLVMSLTGTLIAYASWAFQVAGHDTVRPVLAVSVLPVLVALLRYLLMVDRGDGERPEASLIGDRLLLACALVWCALMAWGLYLT